MVTIKIFYKQMILFICKVFSLCTVLFSDVVGFTSTCSKMNPIEVISLLNEMYTRFDGLLEIHNVYKVKICLKNLNFFLFFLFHIEFF